MPLTKESKPLTAFSTHQEHLQFEVMLFGLMSAPLPFVRLMNQLLGDIAFVFCYLDDIIIFSKDIESHFATLEIVLRRLYLAGLKVKVRKCRFLKKIPRVSWSCSNTKRHYDAGRKNKEYL